MKNSSRSLDQAFNNYSHAYQHPTNRLIHLITIPLISFSVLGLIWAIPFPRLEFLGAYNGFVNFASFVIAFSVYYYYRQSPVLSYGMLLLVFIYSAGIVTLEKLHTNNSWPEMWQSCLIVFILAWAAQLIGNKIEGCKSRLDFWQPIAGPLWLMHLFFKKIRIIRS